jgi:hypothetical protein
VLAAEAGWRTGEGGGALLTGGVGQQRGPVSAVGCRRERGKRDSMAAGHRQVGPASTVPSGAV